MSDLRVKIPIGEDELVSVTIPQALTLSRLMHEHPRSHWHKNDCGCCICLHPGGDPLKGYIIGEDGGTDFVTHKDGE